MKRYLLILLTLTIVTGVGYSQVPIKRKKTKKTEQTQSALSRQNQQQTSNNKTKVQSSIKVSEPDGYINGHGYVDLGLPSGIKWATCNVGAKKPQDYGGYYAWGEIKPKSSYDWTNCFDCLNDTGTRWEIYNGEGEIEISPTSGHDTARENWGGTWRMPTATELKELVDKCTVEWTKMNGINGCLITGPNGKSIFLPAAGSKNGTDFDRVGKSGGYSSSSLRSDVPQDHFGLYFDREYLSDHSHPFVSAGSRRKFGQTVRPVIK